VAAASLATARWLVAPATVDAKRADATEQLRPEAIRRLHPIGWMGKGMASRRGSRCSGSTPRA